MSNISSDGSRIRKYAVCLPVAPLTFKLMYTDMIFPGEMCVILLVSIAIVSDPVDRITSMCIEYSMWYQQHVYMCCEVKQRDT